ncbi:MAG: hypothetical protein Ta2D_04740 [Rickettsiales bacterium]|nr:MAG: hypothetical protein Ta2D_04740 [Rickettsiales bacterium]
MTYFNSDPKKDFEGLILLHYKDGKPLYYTLEQFLQHVDNIRNGGSLPANLDSTEFNEVAHVLFNVMKGKEIKTTGKIGGGEVVQDFCQNKDMYSRRMQQILFGVADYNNNTIIGFPPYPNLSNDINAPSNGVPTGTKYNERDYFCPNGKLDQTKYAKAMYNKFLLEFKFASMQSPVKAVKIAYPEIFLNGLTDSDKIICKKIIDAQASYVSNMFKLVGYTTSGMINDLKKPNPTIIPLNVNAFDIAGSAFANSDGTIINHPDTKKGGLEEKMYNLNPDLRLIFNPKFNKKQQNYINKLDNYLQMQKQTSPAITPTKNSDFISPSPYYKNKNNFSSSDIDDVTNFAKNKDTNAIVNEIKNNKKGSETISTKILLYALVKKSLATGDYSAINNLITGNPYLKQKTDDICRDIKLNSINSLNQKQTNDLYSLQQFAKGLQPAKTTALPKPVTTSIPQPTSDNSTQKQSNPTEEKHATFILPEDNSTRKQQPNDSIVFVPFVPTPLVSTSSKKVEKRTISQDEKTLQLELANAPVKVDISFEEQDGSVLTLRDAFKKLLKEKQTLNEAREEMENILLITLSSMQNEKEQLKTGFNTNEDREIARKITKQILKELNISKNQGKQI